MWTFTNQGFVSAVAHREKPHHLMVRARRSEHLSAIFPGEQVTQTENADYRYRVTVHMVVYKQAMLDQINNITYDNFKNSIPDHAYHDACSRVWGVMHSTQPGSHMTGSFPYGEQRAFTGLEDGDLTTISRKTRGYKPECDACGDVYHIQKDGDISWCTGCGNPV